MDWNNGFAEDEISQTASFDEDVVVPVAFDIANTGDASGGPISSRFTIQSETDGADVNPGEFNGRFRGGIENSKRGGFMPPDLEEVQPIFPRRKPRTSRSMQVYRMGRIF